MRHQGSRSTVLSASFRAAWVSASILGASTSAVVAQPRIGHDQLGCVSRDQFTQLVVEIEPPRNVRSAKIYFRSALYPEFYYVPMSLDATSGRFRATLPLPSRETTRIVYYVEAVDVSFQTARSDDLDVDVSDDCRPGPGGLLFPGGNPEIVVGAVRAGAPALPAGFQATGITSILSAAGATAGAGGGIGVPVAIGAAAGAAAGVGVLVATGGNDPGPGSSGAPPMTPGTPTAGGGASPPNTTSIAGAVTSTPGTSTSTSTVPTGPATPSPTTTTTAPTGPSPGPDTTSTVPASPTACFVWQTLGNCQVSFDSCSSPVSSIRRYEWTMLGPPVPEPPDSPSFTFSFAADPRCTLAQPFNRPVRLTVYDDSGKSASVQQNILVRPGASFRGDAGEDRRLSFQSQLVALPADGRVRGRILIDGSPLAILDNGSPMSYQATVGAKGIVIEASLLTPAPPGSLWEMDFSSTPSMVPGSFRVERGTVVSAADRRIVFRSSGAVGETLRFRLDLR